LIPERDLGGFSAEAFLKFGERERLRTLPSENLAVEDEFTWKSEDGSGELREFGDFVESSGKDLDALRLLVNLGADAVVLFFDQKLGLFGVEEIGGVFDGRGEHEADGMEKSDGGCGELIGNG